MFHSTHHLYLSEEKTPNATLYKTHGFVPIAGDILIIFLLFIHKKIRTNHDERIYSCQISDVKHNDHIQLFGGWSYEEH